MSLGKNLSSSLGHIESPSSNDMDQRARRNTSALNPVQDGLVMRDQVKSQSHHEHHSIRQSVVQPKWTAASEMRKFLDSGEEFTWPSGVGHTTGSHCDISDLLPLRWIKKVSDTSTSSVDEFELPKNANSAFQRFTVRTIRTRTNTDQSPRESSVIKDLRHPHIVVFLGTFSHHGHLSILTFPPATCSLREFMKGMSKDIQRIHSLSLQDNARDQLVTFPHGRSLSESSMSGSESHYDSKAIGSAKRLKNPPEDLLRRYFVCLSQGLSYLHQSSICNNNIKPSNVLIDESDSVILTEFDLPRKSGILGGLEGSYKPKYSAPEASNGSWLEEPSDVFSLGCVFLEMATLLIGHDLSELTDHCTSTSPSGAVDAYALNLQKVQSWIDVLTETQSFPTTESHVAEALSSIRKMLDEDPQGRPISRTLWMHFSSISARICPDCDPRHPQAWVPNKEPEQSSCLHSLSRENLELDNRDIESEVSSIVSVGAPSIFSGQETSSTTSAPEDQGGPEEFARVLLNDEVMAPLYVAALHKTDIEKLERNLVRLLKSYAKDLRLEAITELERTAVKFARRYAQSVANHLCESLDPSRNPRYREMHLLSEQAPRNKENIEKYLQQIAKFNTHSNVPDTTKALQDTTIKPKYGHSDDSGSDEVDHMDFSQFGYVKNFMTKSQAYARLRENFQAFVEPVSEIKDQERPNRELLGKRVPVISTSEDSDGAIENREEALVDQDRLRDNVEINSKSDGSMRMTRDEEEISAERSLTKDRVGPLSESDDSKDTTETSSTTTDSSENQRLNVSIAAENPIKCHWYIRCYKILKGAIALAAEFSGAREKPIENGVERVRWTCVCRRRLYDDFRGVSPDAIEELKDYLNHLYAPTSRIIAGSSSASQADSQCSGNMSLNPTTTVIQPSGAAHLTPGKLAMDGSPVGLRRLQRHRASSDLRESYDLDSSCRWVFPIFQQKRHGRKLIHMPVGVRDSDESLFLALNRYYSQSTTRLVRYLSLRGVSKIHYVRFVFTECGPDIKATDHWPPLRHCPPWTYKGCPAKKKDLPLVGHSLLMHLWHNPSHSDRHSYYSHRSGNYGTARHVLSFFQILVPARYRDGLCGRPEEATAQTQTLGSPEAARGNNHDIAPATVTGADIEMAKSNSEAVRRDLEIQTQGKNSYVLLRTPKKAGERLLPNDVDPPEGWGLYFEEGLRINRLFVFILFLYLCGTLVFGIVWSCQFGMVGPQSGLGAFGVSSWMVGLMSIITTVWLKWAD